MRKLLILFLCLASVFLFSSCGNSDTAEKREPVVINMPKDDSVNGYRTEDVDSSDNTIISADKVGVDSTPPQNTASKNEVSDKQPSNTDKTEISNSNNSGDAYCANKNSGVFHKAECSSVAKMKEENKAYFESSELAISNGYKPCGRCKP